MHRFGVLNRQKPIKETSSGLTVKFTVKKLRILFESCFNRKILTF